MRLVFGVLVFLLLATPSISSAASLSLSPSAGSYNVGDTIAVKVLVSSPSESANAVSGTLSFPYSIFTAESVLKSGSILNFWPSEPTISQSDGTATFEGVALSGYQGSTGVVVTVVLRTTRAGEGNISFKSGQILANDGKGTDITSGLIGAAFTVRTAPTQPVDTIPTTASSGSKVVITSLTHPDQNKWYRVADVELNWKNPVDATAVRIGYDKYPSGLPSVIYDPIISQKTLNLKDGVWYFHLQERRANGWGPVSTFRIQIDTIPPNPVKIQFPHGTTSSDPRPVILFNTTDDLSGVNRYDVAVRGNSLVTVSKDDVPENPYPIPEQQPGTGSVTVTAYDEAGNSVSDQANFEISGLEAPKLDTVEDITSGNIFQVSGITIPNARVYIYVKDSDRNVASQWVRSTADGGFRVIWEKVLSVGAYSVTAQATDDKGAKSFTSVPTEFNVKEKTFLTIGWLTVTYQTFFLVIGTIIVVLLFIAWSMWREAHMFRRRLVTKVGIAEASLHEQFAELKDALAEEITALEKIKSKRQLTVEEERFINRFSKMLDRSKRVVDDKIKDIVPSGTIK